MKNFYKVEEKTATDNQVKASVKTMLGIMEHRKEIELPTDKKQLKIVLENSVSYFNEWLQGNNETWTSGNTSDVMLMSDYSKFDKCYKYLPDADVPQGIKECLIAAVTEQAFAAGEAPKAAKAPKAPKASKAKAAKAALTTQAKEKPEDSKAVSVSIKLDDDTREAGAAMGLSPSDVAKFAHLLAKANS